MSATQIQQRQIANGAIADAQVAAGAAIASSKLADGANFIKKDGSVAMTGALNMNSQLINNVTTPSSANDAANKTYVDTIFNQIPQLFKFKGTAKSSTTANVTVANPGTAVFDGITLTTGDYLALLSQTAQAENGLYTFNGSGSALTRVPQMDAWAEVPGAMFNVEQGTTNADKIYLCTSDSGGTLGTTAITFIQINSSGLTTANFVTRETPTGSINGSNTTFTLANTPTAGTEEVFLNGILQAPGAGNDYTISGATITMLTAPLTGERLLVNYRK
jgi:hypothetical protein